MIDTKALKDRLEDRAPMVRDAAMLRAVAAAGDCLREVVASARDNEFTWDAIGAALDISSTDAKEWFRP